MEKKQPITIADLTSFHQRKVLERAFQWRAKNHAKIMDLMNSEAKNFHGCFVEPHQPTGARIFDPEQWTAANWRWFSLDFVLKNIPR